MAAGALNINADSDCSSTRDPDMALSHNLGLDVTLAESGSTGNQDLYGPSGSSTLKYQHGLRCRTTLQDAEAAGATDINTEPGCSRAKDPDLAADSSLGLDVIMVRWLCRPFRLA